MVQKSENVQSASELYAIIGQPRKIFAEIYDGRKPAEEIRASFVFSFFKLFAH